MPFPDSAARSDVISHNENRWDSYRCRFRSSHLHIHTKDKTRGMKRNPISAGETGQKPQRAQIKKNKKNPKWRTRSENQDDTSDLKLLKTERRCLFFYLFNVGFIEGFEMSVSNSQNPPRKRQECFQKIFRLQTSACHFSVVMEITQKKSTLIHFSWRKFKR